MRPDPLPRAPRHAVLARQLRRLGLDETRPPADPETWQRLLGRVDTVYTDADNDRYTLERSIEISSTEMAALHDALARREGFLAAILENAPDGIVVVDATGAVRSFNAAAERMYGWDSSEIVGRPAHLLVPVALRASYEEALARHVAADAPDATPAPLVEVPALRRDGSTFPIRLAAASDLIGGERIITWIIRDISERKALEDALEHQASHDSLTGLPNRNQLLHHLDRALADARERRCEVGVLFIDLDRFKVINDSLGHEAGDRLLVTVADRLRAVVRRDDVVARLGGDEFVVVCPGVTDAATVLEVAERIHGALADTVELGGNEAFVSASVGIARGGGHTSADRLLRSADLAMYRAKHDGRNRFMVFDEDMQAWADARLATENALRRALVGNELRVHYQPVIRLGDGAVIGAEALVRWNRPGVGLVAPGEFLAVAEETGLIVDIGAFVLDDACARAARWHRLWPGRSPWVSVNVAARQLPGAGVAERVAQALDRHRLPPDRLHVELTEETMLADDDATSEALARLQQIGVPLGIDDFGTGWSSLSYLRRVPAAVLKMDRGFVEDIDRDRSARTIVGAVVTMAQALGMSVIAEGVERAEQAAALAGLGCDAAQGHHFGAPTAADVVEERLAPAAGLSEERSVAPAAPAR